MTWPEPSTVRFVDVDGRRIAYVVAGRGARSVLLVHGNFASKRWFAPLLAAPAGDHDRLIALDLPGFGDSERLPGPPSIAAYGTALVGAARALGLERPVLLGHSLGGTVAMAAAAAAPDAWAGLMLVSSGAPSGLTTPEAHYALLAAFRHDRALLARALAATMPTVVPDDFETLVDDALAMDPEGFTGNARALAALAERPELDLTPHLAPFAEPVLVLRGALDTLVTTEMAATTLAAFGSSRFAALETWDDLGHGLPLEAPTRLRHRLATFLARTHGASPPARAPTVGGAMT